MKDDFAPEKYIVSNIDKYERSLCTQLRCGILPLRLETGRYQNINVEMRTCQLCNNGDVEDEMHFLFACDKYSGRRQQFYNVINDREFDNMNNVDKLRTCIDKYVYLFSKYLKDIYCLRKETIYNIQQL